MSPVDRPGPPRSGESTTVRAIRVRLLGAIVAICAGVVALLVAILLVRSVLG